MDFNDRKKRRRRRPTFTPRFGPQSVALEIGLVRLALKSGERGVLDSSVQFSKDK